MVLTELEGRQMAGSVGFHLRPGRGHDFYLRGSQLPADLNIHVLSSSAEFQLLFQYYDRLLLGRR